MPLLNIGKKEITKRKIFGIIFLVFSLLIFAFLYFNHFNPSWSFILFPFYFVSALGFFQANQKICVMLAFKGTCNMDSREEKITDIFRTGRLRRASSVVILKSLLVSIVATLISFLIL